MEWIEIWRLETEDRKGKQKFRISAYICIDSGIGSGGAIEPACACAYYNYKQIRVSIPAAERYACYKNVGAGTVGAHLAWRGMRKGSKSQNRYLDHVVMAPIIARLVAMEMRRRARRRRCQWRISAPTCTDGGNIYCKQCIHIHCHDHMQANRTRYLGLDIDRRA